MFRFPKRRVIVGLLILKCLIYSADSSGPVFADEPREIKYPLVRRKLSSIGLLMPTPIYTTRLYLGA